MGKFICVRQFIPFQFSLHKMISTFHNNSKHDLLNSSSELALSEEVLPQSEIGNVKFTSMPNLLTMRINGMPCKFTYSTKMTMDPSSDSEEPVTAEVNLVELMNKMANVYLENPEATEAEKAFILECKKLPNILKEELNMEVKSTDSESTLKMQNVLGYAGTTLGAILGLAGGAYAGSTVGGFVGPKTASIFGIIGGINGGLAGFVSVIPFLLYLEVKRFFSK